MDKAAYEQWWQIHVRAARGEQLSAEERTLYEAGCQDLDSAEQLRLVQDASELRDQLKVMEKERGQLEQRRLALYAEIAALEKQLPQQTQLVLGIKE